MERDQPKLDPAVISLNTIKSVEVLSVCHSREGGNPGIFELESRLRGSDSRFAV